MNSIFNGFIARVVQDLATSVAAYLAANGFITHDQETGFVGATFFLAMVVVNYIAHRKRQDVAYNAGVNDAAMTASIQQGKSK